MLGQPTIDLRGVKKDALSETGPQPDSRQAQVKKWLAQVRKARDKWADDYDRMRENMDFVAGYQWKGQKKLRSKNYVANMTLKAVNQKVSVLYAKQPTFQARRKPRLDFELWDERIETLQAAVQSAAEQFTAMGQIDPQTNALLADYERGQQQKQMMDRLGRTLTLLFQYMMDSQEPEFKTQAKLLVRRVCVCGVGYVRLNFEREYSDVMLQSTSRPSPLDRMRRAQAILNEASEESLDEVDAKWDELRTLMLTANEPRDGLQEKLVFDFLRATAIIPSETCRQLKGFIGASWVAVHHRVRKEFVREFYEVDLDQETKAEVAEGQQLEGKDEEKNCWVDVYEVFDKKSRSRFVVCDGHPDYLEAPSAVEPRTNSFWPLYALTFNDVEVEDGCVASPFPPSDVDLMFHAQKEWNRTRNSLRKQRIANAPKYLTAAGMVEEKDLVKITESDENEVITVKAVTDKPLDTVLTPMRPAPIDPMMYDTTGLEKDVMYATGMQQANLGPAQPDVTATVGTIAEQSRMSVSSSDVDALDDFLSELGLNGGQMLLREASAETVLSVCGIGMLWPSPPYREQAANEIMLEVSAASSGRPNKAVEVANWERLGAVLSQFGANPQAVIRETIKRADERLDPTEFFPQLPQAMPQSTMQGMTPQQPLQPASSGVAVPLAGA